MDTQWLSSIGGGVGWQGSVETLGWAVDRQLPKAVLAEGGGVSEVLVELIAVRVSGIGDGVCREVQSRGKCSHYSSLAQGFKWGMGSGEAREGTLCHPRNDD